MLMVTVPSALVLYGLNKRFTASPVAPLPRNYRVAIFCDTGNDPDDVFAHIYQARHMRERVSLIATTLYDPQEKARICSAVFKQLGIQPRIVSGYGATGGNQEAWMRTYPCWPLKFGIPGSTNTVSLVQGKAYREKFAKDMEEAPIEIETTSQALGQLLEGTEKNLVIIGQAPLTDLTKACDKMPRLLQRVDRIVLMGGWFCDETGAVSRLGYNTAVDLKSAKHILTQKDTSVLIVNSELTKHFPLKESELQVLEKSQHKTSLGEALSADMHSYWENKKPAKGNLGLADILTSYLAQHPEEISQTIPVRLDFNEELVAANIDMFHEQSKRVIQVEKVAKSNIQLVAAVKNPEQTRLFLISEIATLFYPNVPSASFQKIFSRVNAENIDDIAHELNSWPKARL
jgi:inosine-uridine nucleoside N-ribohydrolase